MELCLAARSLDRGLEVFAHKGDEVEAMDGVGVEEDAFADILRGFGFEGCKGVGFFGPVERAVVTLAILLSNSTSREG